MRWEGRSKWGEIEWKILRSRKERSNASVPITGCLSQQWENTWSSGSVPVSLENSRGHIDSLPRQEALFQHRCRSHSFWETYFPNWRSCYYCPTPEAPYGEFFKKKKQLFTSLFLRSCTGSLFLCAWALSGADSGGSLLCGAWARCSGLFCY